MSGLDFDPGAEWLETDGLGGFASGTVGGVRTRRYHALLLAAQNPPAGRHVLVNGLDAWLNTPEGTFAITSQAYAPGVIHPDRGDGPESFDPQPWPRWTFRSRDGTRVEHECFVVHDSPVTVLTWRLAQPRRSITLSVRPFLSGRDYHRLHHENGDFRFTPRVEPGRWVFEPYPGVSPVAMLSNGDYWHEPFWYRQFLYADEQQRGLDALEDLAAPGTFRWDLTAGEAVLILVAGAERAASLPKPSNAVACAAELRKSERRRRAAFPSPLHRAADAYIVRRGRGKTIIAGYPWFADWGRDTFIALRGLCLAGGRFDDARSILVEWSAAVSEGMLPNRFPDRGESPEYNSVDASLWFVVCVHELEAAAAAGAGRLSSTDRDALRAAVLDIIRGYHAGTRYGIRCDEDGLLAAGVPGVQLTWMDAKIGDWVVTPRIGKPVEVQALWLNALEIASRYDPRWRGPFDQGLDAFYRRFWNGNEACLYDVVDVDHRPGAVDAAIRPNQILAAGGLPLAILAPEPARRVVDVVERELLTPLGLRSLSRRDSRYAATYEGAPDQRDSVYHQGTVWPWLIGPFVDAWVRTHGRSADARHEARRRFLAPLREHLSHAGIGHVSEIADGDPPHHPRGCPFQAWSLGELIRAEAICAV